MNEIQLAKLDKFEDLQKASFILRKALRDIRSITSTSSKSQCLNLSSSSNNSSISEETCIAYDNLTYSSSVESLNQNKLNQADWKKNTLKSIKRKDKMRKVPVRAETNSCLVHAKSMPSLETKLISNNEYEKQLRKLFRNKSLNRSMRRAKSVYYRNRRSKSLEDLSAEEKMNFLKNTSSSYLRLNDVNRSRSRSIDSCSSNATSTGLASDISSSYFHELSDWSPDFSSSESDSSEDCIFFDLQRNLSGLVFSEFNSSEDSDSELDDEERIFKKDFIHLGHNSEQESLKEMVSKKLDNDSKTIESMLNEVMSRMLSIHPSLQKNQPALSTSNLKNYFLNYFQITNDYLMNSNEQSNCFICLSNFDIDDEAAKLSSCEHVYHKVCLQLWLSNSAVCPMCSNLTGLLERSNSLVSNQRSIKRETLL